MKDMKFFLLESRTSGFQTRPDVVSLHFTCILLDLSPSFQMSLFPFFYTCKSYGLAVVIYMPYSAGGILYGVYTQEALSSQTLVIYPWREK